MKRIALAQTIHIFNVVTLANYLHRDVIKGTFGAILICLLFESVQPFLGSLVVMVPQWPLDLENVGSIPVSPNFFRTKQFTNEYFLLTIILRKGFIRDQFINHLDKHLVSHDSGC